MKPGSLSLTIIRGATFRRRLIWKAPPAPGQAPQPLDLTGYTGRAQVRVAGVAVLTLDSDASTAPDGTITFAADGSIELYATDTVASGLPMGHGAWSLEVQPPGGDRDVLLAGHVTITGEPTL